MKVFKEICHFLGHNSKPIFHFRKNVTGACSWIWIWELSYKHTNSRMRYLCFVSFHEPVDGIEWGSPLGPNGFTEFSAQKFYPNSSNTDRFVLPSNSGNVPCEPRSTQWMPFTCILFNERMSVKCKYSNWIKVVQIPMASRAVNSVVI